MDYKYGSSKGKGLQVEFGMIIYCIQKSKSEEIIHKTNNARDTISMQPLYLNPNRKWNITIKTPEIDYINTFTNLITCCTNNTNSLS